MTHKLLIVTIAIAVSIASLIPFSCCSASADGREKQAMEVLRKSCAHCHGEGNEKHGDIDFITDPKRLRENGLVVPGQPDASQLLVRMLDESDPMPPLDAPPSVPRPSKEDMRVVKEWIATQTEAPSVQPSRMFAPPGLPSYKKLHARMVEFLEAKAPSFQKRIRFFSFVNLAQLQKSPNARNKNFQKIDLASHRAALAKALNSLSWRSDIAKLESVDQDSLILAVDLGDLWNRDSKEWNEKKEWNRILAEYPYGFEVQSNDFEQMVELTGSPLPIVRADWFIATALRPPLYHELLQIPEQAQVLEKFLGVDVNANILARRAVRVGFTESGISKNANRLIERHHSRFGYYWKSYDFLSGANQGNLFQFPTGPSFLENPFDDRAFIHDGGEILFSLPNGLQAYMLASGVGTRIDAGPAELVSDEKRTSGSPLIVNGVSCVACHRHGIYPYPKDQVVTETRVGGDLLAFVRELHDERRAEALTIEDRDRFMKALDSTLRPWLDPDKMEGSLPEPIFPIASTFVNSELGLAEIAAELGIDEAALELRIANNDQLKNLGMTPLVSGGVLKRDDWQKSTSGNSNFQQACRFLKLGVPITVLKNQ